MLVFSLSQIQLVQIQFNEEGWLNATHVKGPLYVIPWNPKLYSRGINHIHVRARDADGREQGISQPFSLDGTRMDFRFWPRLALMSNISTVVSVVRLFKISPNLIVFFFFERLI